MSFILESKNLSFAIDLSQSHWSLYPKKGKDVFIENAKMNIAYRFQGSRKQVFDDWIAPQLSEVYILPSQHGDLQVLQLVSGQDVHGVSISIEFALSEQYPIFLWRLTLINQATQSIYPQRLTLLSTSFKLDQFYNPAFFSNGWGSWNHTGSFGVQDFFKRSQLGPFYNPMRVNAGTPQPRGRGHFASDFFGILGDRQKRVALLAGFLSQKNHFGSLEASLNQLEPSLSLWANGDSAQLDPGESIRTDWACLVFLNIDDPYPLSPYIEAVSREHEISNSQQFDESSPTGWCSWYQFFQQVSAVDLRGNLKNWNEIRDDLPIQIFQIDDGFETHVGDWFDFRPTFTDGLSTLAQEINAYGFTPGLWLAPFILERKSNLARRHPDWLLRGMYNQPVNAGFIWNQFTTALDLTHPDALTYTEEVIYTAVHDWGYPYLKLDFLYAAALPGNYQDKTQTRAQVLRKGLEHLRAAAGEDAFMLGCGCPLGSAIGIVNAMRIGADVSERWRPHYYGTEIFLHAEPDMPSVRNAIQNALTRSPFHRKWWYNDPDCLLLRPTTALTLAEIRSSAAVIALTDGMLILSDDMKLVPEDRLKIAKSIIPPIGKAARIWDWFDRSKPTRLSLKLVNQTDKWNLLSIFNWNDEARDITLHLKDFGLDNNGSGIIAREFWSGQIYEIIDGHIACKDIPPHGNLIFALREPHLHEPQYLGSDLHISQGKEVTDWRWDHERENLSFSIARPGITSGEIDLYLPREPISCEINKSAVPLNSIRDNIYRLKVNVQEQAQIQIRF